MNDILRAARHQGFHRRRDSLFAGRVDDDVVYATYAEIASMSVSKGKTRIRETTYIFQNPGFVG
jgi:hypothetical protein